MISHHLSWETLFSLASKANLACTKSNQLKSRNFLSTKEGILVKLACEESPLVTVLEGDIG